MICNLMFTICTDTQGNLHITILEASTTFEYITFVDDDIAVNISIIEIFN